MAKDTSTDIEKTSVLVTSHAQTSQSHDQSSQPQHSESTSQSVFSAQTGSMPSQYHQGTTSHSSSTQVVPSSQSGIQQFMPQPQQFMPQLPSQHYSQSQYFGNQFRGFSRGRRGRCPRFPCDFFGKSNHTTNYCCYKPSQYPPPFSSQYPPPFPSQYSYDPYQSYQWRSGSQQYYPPYAQQFSTSMPMQAAPYTRPPPPPAAPQFSYNGLQPRSPLSRPSFAGYVGQFPTQNVDHSFAGYVGHFPTQNVDPSFATPGVFSGYSGSAHSFPPTPQQWYFDSGATNHVTHNLQNIQNPQPSRMPDGVLVGNGNSLLVAHTGKGLLPTPHAQFLLSHIMHTPSITHNLISVYQFSKDNNCSLIFDSTGLVIQDKTTHKILYKGPCNQGLYPILNFSESSSVPTALHSSSDTAMMWHSRLGHPSLSLFQSLIKQYSLLVSKPLEVNCSCCNKAKSHKLQFPLSVSHTTAPFQLVHMDVWGPSPIPSHKGFRYYLLVIDDFTRYSWLFPLHYKSQVKHTIAEFKAFVSTQFNITIQTVRSDNGGEFINLFLRHLFLSAGIIHQTTCPHTPEQNGVVERKHRHLIETTVTLLLQSKLPVQFWLEALTTTVYLTNRLPHTSLNFQVPYTLLFHVNPDYLFLPFGCACYPWLKPYTSRSLMLNQKFVCF